MSDLIPISNEALKTLRGVGAFFQKALGSVPEDLVGYLGADWLKIRRAENIVKLMQGSAERLKAWGIKNPESASLAIALPILRGAADESREQLQDLWARLLASAMDPSRATRVRRAFIDAVSKMDPLDAVVLSGLQDGGGQANRTQINQLAEKLNVQPDEVDVSVGNLIKLELLRETNPPNAEVSSFGREFLRAISDTEEDGVVAARGSA
jgi:hypothetical protein